MSEQYYKLDEDGEYVEVEEAAQELVVNVDVVRRKMPDGVIIETRESGLQGWTTVNIFEMYGTPLCVMTVPDQEVFGEAMLQLERARQFQREAQEKGYRGRIYG